jgi:hypothetical protein
MVKVIMTQDTQALTQCFQPLHHQVAVAVSMETPIVRLMRALTVVQVAALEIIILRLTTVELELQVKVITAVALVEAMEHQVAVAVAVLVLLVKMEFLLLGEMEEMV